MTDNHKTLAAIEGAIKWRKRMFPDEMLVAHEGSEGTINVRVIQAALEAAKALIEDGEWKPIESAPKDNGVWIKIKHQFGEEIAQVRYDLITDGNPHYANNGGLLISFIPTHWKPLDSDIRALEILNKLEGEN